MEAPPSSISREASNPAGGWLRVAEGGVVVGWSDGWMLATFIDLSSCVCMRTHTPKSYMI